MSAAKSAMALATTSAMSLSRRPAASGNPPLVGDASGLIGGAHLGYNLGLNRPMGGRALKGRSTAPNLKQDSH